MTIEIDTNKHKERNSSFELLRILCMLFVIGGHLIGKGMQIPYNGTSPWGGGGGTICSQDCSTAFVLSL